MKLNDFIDKYRLPIAGVLLVLIAVGGFLLIYKRPPQTYASKEQLEKIQKDIADLNIKIEDLNKKLAGGGQVNTSSTVIETVQKVAGSSTESQSQPSGKININTANQSQLESLPGIGPVIAKAIIDYRIAHGGFKSIEEINNVKRIGDQTYGKIKDLITI
jgi:comEA protein